MMKKVLLSIMAASICLPALAGDKEREREEYMKQVRDKEMGRANEAASSYGDVESVEKKYGYLKEGHPEKFEEMKQRRLEASRAWKEVAKRMSHIRDYEDVSIIKMPAQKADAIAELARLELRAASSEMNWMKTADKADSGAAKRAARALIENQREMIETTKKKLISEQRLRELSLARGELDKELREEYEKSKRKPDGRRDDKRRVEERPRRDVKLRPVEPPRRDDRPVKPSGPGGVVE